MVQQEFLYYAFISYRHADVRWAKWLKRKLQTYRLPLRLHKQHVDLPRRLSPIFYDVNLRPGGLNDRIREEISASKYLIVICSREAAGSPKWLDQEIDFFLENGGSRDRIIPVIVDRSAEPEKETFPPRMRELNGEEAILGVDIPAVGKRQAILKIVSFMHGIRIEELESEDKKRRRRNVLLAAAFSLLLAFGAAAAGVSMKNLAIARQKAEAGRLLEISASARTEGDQRTAVRSALDALNISPDEAQRLTAEDRLVRALRLYEQDALYPESVIRSENEYAVSAYMTTDGKTLMIDHGDAVTAYDVLTREKRWTLPFRSAGQPFMRGDTLFYLSEGGTIREIDPETGREIRAVTEGEEYDELCSLQRDFRQSYSDRLWRETGEITIRGKSGSVTIPCASQYCDTAFLDDDRVLFAGNREISVYSLRTGEKTEIVRLDQDLFYSPVRILTGQTRILCILNGHFFCLDHEGNVLTPAYEKQGQVHELKNGIIAAFWADPEETTAMWIGCDGRACVAGGDHFYYCRLMDLNMGKHWTYACIPSSHPERIALIPDSDPFAIHLWRLGENPDAALAANCVPEGSQYDLFHGGRYLFRYNSLDTEFPFSYDLVRTEDLSVLWSYRGETKLDPDSFFDFAAALSTDGKGLYLGSGDLYRTDTGELTAGESAGYPENVKSVRSVLGSDGVRPVIVVSVVLPAGGIPEIIVREEEREAWRAGLPVSGLNADKTDLYVSGVGENGWCLVSFTDRNTGEKRQVLADVIGHRTCVPEAEIAPEWIYQQLFFGSDPDDPVLMWVGKDALNLVRCADGKAIRDLTPPAGAGRLAGCFVLRDRYLFLYDDYSFSVWIVDAKTGDIVFSDSSHLPHFSFEGTLDLTLAEDRDHIWYVLHNRLEGDLQDGLRIDTKHWTVDRHYPMADSFIPSLGKVICMDQAELKRWLYPDYSREELKDLAAAWLRQHE